MKNNYFYVYMLRCDDNSIYTGITSDLLRRFSEHKAQKSHGAKYTKSKKVTSIDAAWITDSKQNACKLEYHLKTLNKQTKEHLISEKISLSDAFNHKIKDYKRLSLFSNFTL